MSNKIDPIIARVLHSNDPYTVLNIKRDATEEEIDKAYKRLCLILHPDRCKHSKAEEAFKKLANIKSNLIDRKKRQFEYSRSEFIRSNRTYPPYDHDIFDSFYRDYNSPFRNRFFIRRSNNVFDNIFSDYYRGQNYYRYAQYRSSRNDPSPSHSQIQQDEIQYSFLFLIIFMIFLFYFS